MSTLHDKTTVVPQTARQEWRHNRLEMERGEVKQTPLGRRHRHWSAFKTLIGLLKARNLFEIIGYLQEREGVHFELRAVR